MPTRRCGPSTPPTADRRGQRVARSLVPQQQNLSGLMPEDATASVPAPAWLNAPTDARAFESQAAGYRIVAGRDSLSMIDPLARLDASSWPHDEGVMPYLLSAHANPPVRAVDAADR